MPVPTLLATFSRSMVATSFGDPKMIHAFEPFALGERHSRLGTDVSSWHDTSIAWAYPQVCTTFGYVHRGPSILSTPHGDFILAAGMYFALPGPGHMTSGAGLLIHALGYRGFFHLGGPVEITGRLRYIDGCTDSLLIAPVMLGDPCLNLLHLPPRTIQTTHTHPSIRVGLILEGQGTCVTPDARYPLAPGLAFIIEPDGLHAFHTDDQALRVLAYHPDSDFGPTHENHPMVNRTIIPGT